MGGYIKCVSMMLDFLDSVIRIVVDIVSFATVSSMIPLAKQCAFEEPSVETITGENVLTWPYVVSKILMFTPFLL